MKTSGSSRGSPAKGLIRGFRLKLRPGVVFVVFLGSAEDEGGPLDSLVKEANRLGATCYGTRSNVGAEPQGGEAPMGQDVKGAKHQGGGVPPSAVGDYGDGFGGRFRQRRDLSVDGG
ncbi:hypothetical protein GEV33_005782 [Tenebrio molitor]|uniref:Uncharacterized protein n=1 Tax=Tenebrio molitor TaxID=7067 RepID=A0A8J6HLU0_TENMO|nr:hypothetical protein GEV33_005782 [Tenebrio molitor]